MRISDWSSDVCSSDLAVERGGDRGRVAVRPAIVAPVRRERKHRRRRRGHRARPPAPPRDRGDRRRYRGAGFQQGGGKGPRTRQRYRKGEAVGDARRRVRDADPARRADDAARSEEHTSELQSLVRISYAVFCLKKKTNK